MTELIINISKVDPRFQKALKRADESRNGEIDTAEEITTAANLLCEEKPDDLVAAEACLKKTIGIETSNVLITWEPSLFQSMDKHLGASWQKSNWSNGNPFASTWQPNNIKFEGGIMRLVLDNLGCPGSCDGKPFASGEYRTKKEAFRYGYYEVRMKAAKGEGLVAGTFFTYRGTYEKASHDEIDFEFLGKEPDSVQTNYYARGKGNHEKMIDLGFDASKEFHNYGFKLTPDSLTWYIDGKEVRTATAAPGEKLPSRPAKIMVNFWPGIPDVIDWLGSFKYPGKPLQAEYDWIKYSPLTPAKIEPQPAPIRPAAPGSILTIDSIQQGSFAFNNGKLSSKAGVYQFSSAKSKDPGFGILTGNTDLQGRKTLKFEIKGNFTRHGAWARFIAQVYDQTDNDYTPSVSLDPVELTDGFSTATIDLEGEIGKLKKVQFLLVTDNGSCQVEIKDIRFE